MALEWLALKDWTETTKAKPLDMLKRVVFPRIGGIPVVQVTPQVLDVLTPAAKVNGRGVAVEARRSMSGVLELALATLWAARDPVYRVR